MKKFDNKYKNNINQIIFIIAIVFSLIHLHYPVFGMWKTNRIIFLMFCLLIIFLDHPLKSNKPSVQRLFRFVDLFLILLVLLFSFHPIINFNEFLQRYGALLKIDIIYGVIGFLLTLEAVRRTLGYPMIFLCSFFVIYAYLGPYMPDIIAHKGLILPDIVDAIYVTPEGLYGLPVSVMSSYVFLFIIFGSLLSASGGVDHLMNLANALVGKTIGGPAKLSVISSGLMASISGSAVSNVVTTGAMTIPMMKRIGLKPAAAGGIEAAASTGGMITPPIMGAVAFVMSEMIGVPYIRIIIIAIIPAFLYYFAMFIAVDLECKKANLPITGSTDLSIFQVLKNGWWMFISIILLFILLSLQITSSRAILFCVILMIIAILVQNGFKHGIEKIAESFDNSARVVAPIGAICAAAGIIISMLYVTGLGLRLNQILLELSGGIPIIALILIMIICIILGMGLPATAAYITTAALSSSFLLNFGFTIEAVHFFIMFFAVLSNITPPVCLATYTATGIANSDFWKTAFYGMRIGFSGYIIPFLFIYSPSLLLVNSSFIDVVKALFFSLILLYSLAIVSIGFLDRKINILERSIIFIFALLLFFPTSLITNIASTLALLLFIVWIKKGKSLNPTSPNP